MVTRHVLGAVIALFSFACSEKKPVESARQTGERPYPGGASAIAGGGSGGSTPGGGTSSDAAAGASCPPRGLFRRISQAAGPVSAPGCPPLEARERAFFGPITTSHQVKVRGVACTFDADVVSDDECSFRRVVRCDDGTSTNTECAVGESGTVRCTARATLGLGQCEVVSEYEPDPEFRGDCDGIEGPYTRSSEQTGDAVDCPEVTQGEVADVSELAIDPSCTLKVPAPDGSCKVTLQEMCDGDGGVGATHTCEVNANATEVRCAVARGSCRYDVSLVR